MKYVQIDKIRKQYMNIGTNQGQTKERTKTEIFDPKWSCQFILWNNSPAERIILPWIRDP
jgi:hypothetical protein